MHGKTIHGGQELLTLTDLLQQRAAQYRDRTAFVFHSDSDAFRAGTDGAETAVRWTFGQLDDRARAIGAWLSQHAEAGDRALLVYAPGLDFVAAYFGCVYAGVLPVPATYPKPRRPLPRLATMARDCQPRLVLTSHETLDTICLEQQEPVIRDIPWQTTDMLDTPPIGWQPVSPAPDDLAFLQYTSGSTTEPRGVMVSHRNLLHNLEMIRCGFGVAPAGTSDKITTGLFWLPAYHDMGLIGGILTPLYVGGTSHFLTPATFLRRPMNWLEALSATRAEISGAPNFAYELCVAKSKLADRAALDLRSWRLAFCGAEPIQAATLSEFAEAFAPAGFQGDSFYPCYGLAEATLLVSGARGPNQPHVLQVDRASLANHQIELVDTTHSRRQSLVGCGGSLDSQELRIVDPKSCRPKSDGTVGEIWVRGDSVARGYWQQEKLSEEVFSARPAHGETAGGEMIDGEMIAGRNGEAGLGQRAFLRTGDLGFQLDGQLFIAGRLKDIIILRGRNHYPQDIERTAQQSHEAVDTGAAFTVSSSALRTKEAGQTSPPQHEQEQLVVVHQIRREHRKADLDEVMRAIRRAIVEEHELDPQVIVLIRPVSLPLTSSGKVQRSLCREMLVDDRLPVKAQWVNPRSPAQSDDMPPTDLPLEGAPPVDSPPVRPDFAAIAASTDPDQLAAAVEDWMLTWLADRAGIERTELQSSTPFAELGVDSLTAIELSQELEEALQLKIPPAAAWDHPTPAALAQFLAEMFLAGVA